MFFGKARVGAKLVRDRLVHFLALIIHPGLIDLIGCAIPELLQHLAAIAQDDKGFLWTKWPSIIEESIVCNVDNLLIADLWR